MVKSYKDNFSLNDRVSESCRVLAKYPDKIPVIIETTSKEIYDALERKKFLAPREISISHLTGILRKRSKLSSNKALFLFCDNKLVSSTTIMNQIYEDYIRDNLNTKKDNDVKKGDRFLYISVNFENTFG